MSGKTILLVDDEPDILEFMEYNLQKEGFEVLLAENGLEGVELAQKNKPDVIVLDIMMPQMDGFEACKEIRKDRTLNQALIIFLTAKGDDQSQIEGLEIGADDFVNKPVQPKVLISRIKALLRRAKPQIQDNSEVIDLGEFIIDKEKYLIFKDGNEMSFPRKEFNLLLLLTSKPGKVFTREEILTKVWGGDVIVGDRTIDVHVRKLREKLGDKYFKTIKGIGYKFLA